MTAPNADTLLDPPAPAPASAAAHPHPAHADALDDPTPAGAAPPARAALPFSALVATHGYIDIFPILFAVLLLPLREKLGLTSFQVTFVVMATPIFSGFLQPIFARLTDKHDTRVFGPLGLAIGATCIGSIGFVTEFWQLVVLQITGVIATGFYHPIATALAGQTGGRVFRNGRAQAIGVFIFAGMIGHAVGAKLGPLINSQLGMAHLAWLIPPALLLALLLHLFTNHLPHRHASHRETGAGLSRAESRRRWRTVAVLAAQNALRFVVQVGLLTVLFNVWAESRVLLSSGGALSGEEVAEQAAVHVGSLATAMTLGMAVGVVFLGRVVPKGRERGPLMWLSFLGAVCIALFGVLANSLHDRFGWSPAAMLPLYALVAVGALGYFSTFPVAASLAQRLIPHHTGLVTSLMMGVGWGVSASSALLAIAFFGGVAIDRAPTLEPERIALAFVGFAALLVLAGLLTLFIPKDLTAAAADHD